MDALPGVIDEGIRLIVAEMQDQRIAHVLCKPG